MKMKQLSPIERFLAKTERQENGCLFWTAARSKLGYGKFGVSSPRRVVLAYKWWWEQTNGPVPDGLELDHLCRNSRCVEPIHLEAVPHRINVLRGNSFTAKHAQKTHCPLGHPYDASNTYWSKNGRDCRTCRKRRDDERHTREKKPQSKKTHCRQGHPYDESNTYWRKKGGRDCRECHKKRDRERYVRLNISK